MDRLLTPPEVSDRFQVPVATLYQWRLRGTGPKSFRVGRHVRYSESDLEAWIQGQRGDAG